MSKNLSHLSGRKGLKDSLFEKIGQLSEEDGTLSESQKTGLAEEYLIGKANITGTISAYDFSKPENKGKKAYVCNGSACMLAGTQEKVKDQLGKHFKTEEIGKMTCLGRCHENSAFHVNGENYSGLAEKEIDTVLKEKSTKPDKYHIGHFGKQILTAEFPGLDKFYAALKSTLEEGPDVTLEKIKHSGLRGRGGAGFPKAYKLEAAKYEVGDEKFIICNADEGGPGA